LLVHFFKVNDTITFSVVSISPNANKTATISLSLCFFFPGPMAQQHSLCHCTSFLRPMTKEPSLCWHASLFQGQRQWNLLFLGTFFNTNNTAALSSLAFFQSNDTKIFFCWCILFSRPTVTQPCSLLWHASFIQPQWPSNLLFVDAFLILKQQPSSLLLITTNLSSGSPTTQQPSFCLCNSFSRPRNSTLLFVGALLFCRSTKTQQPSLVGALLFQDQQPITFSLLTCFFFSQ